MENPSKLELGLVAYNSLVLIALLFFAWTFGLLIFSASAILITFASWILWLFWSQPTASGTSNIGDSKILQFISPELTAVLLSIKKTRKERLEMFALVTTIALILVGFYLYTTVTGIKPTTL